MALAIGIAVLGGIGAMLRFIVDHVVSGRFGRHLPWGTITINVVGSALAGVVVGAAFHGHLGTRGGALLLTGLLGGFTTSSTFSFEVAELVRERRVVAGTCVACATMLAALGGGIAGMALGSI